MDRNLRSEIERLLDEPEDRSDSAGARRLVHARLAADLAEGVNGESVDKDVDSGELARVAAFLDGRLSQTERDAVARTLTRDASFRADLASAAALLDDVDAAPQPVVPAGLLSRAANEFAPETFPNASPAQPQRSVWWHGRRVMWASMVAVLLIAVAAPSALRIIDERLSPPESDDQSLSSRSVIPAKPQMTDPPKITDLPRSLEQNVRPGRPAAKESSAQPAPAAAAPRQRLCDDVAGRAADQLPPDKKSEVAGRRAASSPEFRPRDPCLPRAPGDAIDEPKASTAR